MSNTTLTPLAERHYYVREKQFQITSEDVRSWLMEATRDRRKTTYELNFRIHRLGTALKAVEERAAELEAENARLQRRINELLSEELTDGAVRERIQLRHNLHEVLQENERLRAERDWLAGSLAEDGCPYLAFWADFEGDMRPDWCICTDTADDGFDCTGDPKECWQQEAARRAVAAGEGE